MSAYDLYLTDGEIQDLSIEDQITHHNYAMEYWITVSWGEKYYNEHKEMLMEIMDQEDVTLYL